MGIASEAEAVEIVAGQESGAVVGVGVVIDGYDRSNPLNIVKSGRCAAHDKCEVGYFWPHKFARLPVPPSLRSQR